MNRTGTFGLLGVSGTKVDLVSVIKLDRQNPPAKRGPTKLSRQFTRNITSWQRLDSSGQWEAPWDYLWACHLRTQALWWWELWKMYCRPELWGKNHPRIGTYRKSGFIFGQFSALFTNSKLADFWVLVKIPWVFCQNSWVFSLNPWVFSQKPLSFITRVALLTGTLSFIPISSILSFSLYFLSLDGKFTLISTRYYRKIATIL